MLLWQDHNPHYPSPHATQVEEGIRGTGDDGVKLTLEKKKGVGEGVVLIFLCFSLSNSILIGKELT